MGPPTPLEPAPCGRVASPTARTGLPCCKSPRVRTCCAHCPGEQSDRHVSVHQVALGGLRPFCGDSALALDLSRPAQASLTLRPARLLTRPIGGPLFPELRRSGHPRHRPGSYQDVPTPPWAGLSPAASIYLSRHTQNRVRDRRRSPVAALAA